MSFPVSTGLTPRDRKETQTLVAPEKPRETTIVLGGRIARADIPALCARVGELVEADDSTFVLCDVRALVQPDAIAVDALARLQLTVKRLGGRLSLTHACDELQALLALMGLREVVPLRTRSAFESQGESEEWEQIGRVEEEADPADPTIG